MKNRTNSGSKKAARKVVGLVTTYIGHERRLGGHGTKVLITAVLKRKFDPRLIPDLDPECDYHYVTDNEFLETLGGLDPADSLEVQCRHPREDRWCAVCDEVTDIRQLEAFKDVR